MCSLALILGVHNTTQVLQNISCEKNNYNSYTKYRAKLTCAVLIKRVLIISQLEISFSIKYLDNWFKNDSSILRE